MIKFTDKDQIIVMLALLCIFVGITGLSVGYASGFVSAKLVTQVNK